MATKTWMTKEGKARLLRGVKGGDRAQVTHEHKSGGDLFKTLWTIGWGFAAMVGVTAVLIEFNIVHMLLLCILLAVIAPREQS
jgi:hypothetical protein